MTIITSKMANFLSEISLSKAFSFLLFLHKQSTSNYTNSIIVCTYTQWIDILTSNLHITTSSFCLFRKFFEGKKILSVGRVYVISLKKWGVSGAVTLRKKKSKH